MRSVHKTEIAIIGAGPAGLAAAVAAAQRGRDVVCIERDDRPGGILSQCIHDGFGLFRYRKALTGPEYAAREIERCELLGIPILCDRYVHSIERTEDGFSLKTIGHGTLQRIECRALILAMGCRERAAGALSIPGTRPAGIYSAGTAQRLMNLQNTRVGSRFVIIGSGDIGLIMARRLTLEGSRVEAVVEIQPYPGGLERNIRQCLEDYSIPLLLDTSIVRITGEKRVESIIVAPRTADGLPDIARVREIPCDSILFSVGLIPENELSREAGCRIDPNTFGPIVDSDLMTSVPGIFACGNVLQVHDIADHVSQEAAYAGNRAADWCAGHTPSSSLRIDPGMGIRCCVPQLLIPGRDQHISLRVSEPMRRGKVSLLDENEREIISWEREYLTPSELLTLTLKAGKTPEQGLLEVRCERT